MNADGSGVSNITNNVSEDCVANVSASGRIAFASNREGYFRIYAINPDGSGVTRITNTLGCGSADFVIHPNWSPSAAKIAFVRDCTGTDNDLYVMNADGTGEVRLTTTPDRVEFYPSWSPQGDRIAFEGCFNPSACNSQIYTITPQAAERSSSPPPDRTGSPTGSRSPRQTKRSPSALSRTRATAIRTSRSARPRPPSWQFPSQRPAAARSAWASSFPRRLEAKGCRRTRTLTTCSLRRCDPARCVPPQLLGSDSFLPDLRL
jgi:Tol biopolymer transport system component